MIGLGMYAWTLICKELAKLKTQQIAKADAESEPKPQNIFEAPPGCANLPLDEKILNKVLMLVNLTMSEPLIKKWIAKVRPQLECEMPERLQFEKTVKEI